MPRTEIGRFRGWQIVEGVADDVPDLQSLWIAIHHTHAAAMPELAPYLTDAETWAQRRVLLPTDVALPVALERATT